MKKKVLWLVNSRLPQIARSLNEKGSNTCGWISGAYDYINENFDLTVLYPVFDKDKVHRTLTGEHKHIAFYQHGVDRVDVSAQDMFANIIKELDPDIIDIWGSEFLRSYNMLKAIESLSMLDKTVLSFQGSSAEIGEHYYSDLRGRVIHGKTLRDLLRGDSIYKQRKLYIKRGEYERKSLDMIRYLIGKTDWDKSVALRANPEIQYFRCNEILRDAFYSEQRRWDVERRSAHTLILIQGGYPVKGMHLILRAAAQLKRAFPDFKLKVVGSTPLLCKGMKRKLRMSYYHNYILKLTKKLGLSDAVYYTGDLDAHSLIEEYLSSSVLVTASSIENESNSVSEAKCLGVPVVASCVGGVASRIAHGKDGFLYPYDEPHMLAYYVAKLFTDEELCRRISEAEISSSKITNNRDINNKTREDVYLKIIAKGQC